MDPLAAERESDEVDVCIVGGGKFTRLLRLSHSHCASTNARKRFS